MAALGDTSLEVGGIDFTKELTVSVGGDSGRFCDQRHCRSRFHFGYA